MTKPRTTFEQGLLVRWLNAEFLPAVRDHSLIARTTQSFQAAVAGHGTPEKAMAAALATFVRELIDPSQPVPDGEQ